MNENNVLMVEIPIGLYAELIESRTVLEIVKRKLLSSKYSLDRESVAEIMGVKLEKLEEGVF